MTGLDGVLMAQPLEARASGTTLAGAMVEQGIRCEELHEVGL